LCPNNALKPNLSQGGQALFLDEGLCEGCFSCTLACPSKALFKNGAMADSGEIMSQILYDVGMYQKTGGGVTFSGGEASLQSSFLMELLMMCESEGIHRAIDTCGLCSSKIFMELSRKADLILFDLKHMDGQAHKRLTGADNDLILKNARLLSCEAIPMEIRIPIVPGFNDGCENIAETARFIASLDSVQSVYLLGYHKIGESKICGFGKRMPGLGIPSVGKDRLEQLCGLVGTFVNVPVKYR
jgi:pyruvate formate lyase activating enzyme